MTIGIDTGKVIEALRTQKKDSTLLEDIGSGVNGYFESLESGFYWTAADGGLLGDIKQKEAEQNVMIMATVKYFLLSEGVDAVGEYSDIINYLAYEHFDGILNIGKYYLEEHGVEMGATFGTSTLVNKIVGLGWGFNIAVLDFRIQSKAWDMADKVRQTLPPEVIDAVMGNKFYKALYE